MKHANRWDLPKGHLDPGETKPQAALRELAEETGIQRSEVWVDPEFIFENRYWVSYKRNGNKKQLKELTIYLGFTTTDGIIATTEHEGYAWFDWTPPHQIQVETIDPLLKQVSHYLQQKPVWPPVGSE